MIEKYIELLLKENKRVIIPDFGGFVVKRTASGDAISFNGFLKFNDDLLVAAIANGQECSKEEATKIISKDVEQIVSLLDANGSCELKNVGFLVKDKKGNVRFMDHLPSDNATSETIKDGEKQEKEKATNKSKIATVKSPSAAPTPEPEDVSEDDIPVTQTLLNKPWFIPALIAFVVLLLLALWLVLRPEKIDTLKEGHENMVSEMADQKLDAGKKEKRTLASFFKKSERSEPESAPELVKEEQVLKPVMEPLSRDTVRGVVVFADKKITTKGKERYHVIVGSFKDIKKASSLNNSLIEEGYGSQIFDRYNGWHAVSLGGFPSLDIALMVSGENIKKYQDLWILVK